MILNGEPLTGFPFFLTSIEWSPGSSGVNSNWREPSGAMEQLTGSFFPEGRVNSAFNFGRSSGSLISSLLTDAVHGDPTVGPDSDSTGSSTMILNGEPLTGFPFFFTSIEWSPGSFGVNLRARVPSGAIEQATGSFFPLGRSNSAVSLSRSSGSLMSSLWTLTSHGLPTPGLLRFLSASSTITLKGDPWTGRLSLLTSMECSPASVGMNSKARVPSGATPHLIGSFFPLGRVSSATNLSRSSGRLISFESTFNPHGFPTLGSPDPASSAGQSMSGADSTSPTFSGMIISSMGCLGFFFLAGPTCTGNGDPLTGFPRLLTWTKCSPGSSGTKLTPRVFGSSETPGFKGSFFPLGCSSSASTFFKSRGKVNSGISRSTSNVSPTPGPSSSSAGPTITSNGDPLTGRPRFLTSIKWRPFSSGVKFTARVSSGPTLQSNGSFFPVGRVNWASVSFKSRGKDSSGISRLTSQSFPTAGPECPSDSLGSSTMIVNGESLTCFPFFLIAIRWGPASLGTKLTANELSGPTPNSSGSSWPLGRVRVPFKSFKSLGRSSSGISKLAAQSDPTVGETVSSITIIEKGLFGTCRPSFLTLIKCSPASVGTKETAMVPSGPILTSTGSSLPVGLLKVPLILLISERLQGSGW